VDAATGSSAPMRDRLWPSSTLVDPIKYTTNPVPKATLPCMPPIWRDMELKRAGSQPSVKGPAEWFTGEVRIDQLHSAREPSRVSCASVTFEPFARTNWHTHPLGQTLLVTSGCGWTQCEGEPIVEIRAGDVIWCPANHRHWHGATPTTTMTHIAVQETLNGKAVEWMARVSDEEYLAGPARSAPPAERE
jgi:quercetin dioxygenase-like cupin family protein